jgi:hypothetical protein
VLALVFGCGGDESVAVAGFAGVYRDGATGEWVVLSTRRLDAEEAWRAAFGGVPNVDGRRVRVERVRFDLRDLWRARAVVFRTIPGGVYTLLDLDERENRVLVGVGSAADSVRVTDLLRGRGLPTGIVHVGVVTVRLERGAAVQARDQHTDRLGHGSSHTIRASASPPSPASHPYARRR